MKQHVRPADSPLVLLNELTDLPVLLLYARAFFKEILLQTFIFLPMKEIRSVWFPSNASEVITAR